MLSMRSSLSCESVIQTPAGFPLNGLSVNASMMNVFMSFHPTRATPKHLGHRDLHSEFPALAQSAYRSLCLLLNVGRNAFDARLCKSEVVLGLDSHGAIK